ncbi:uncharacterized protein Tco025E_07794 [Trypanosoma conorhini]|uniref:Uncharacterized protein n=1 Tax=Trypanosoma conorhini TaxID=83891 RepID=A0A3R7LXL5_9TRYP|nr:uncharacterized protein Tco025E_07794 [Trypanosoma conorhini]RNF05318.1 hypothetical protein Tco025E_07794 [Trypanosoma conorhini]
MGAVLTKNPTNSLKNVGKKPLSPAQPRQLPRQLPRTAVNGDTTPQPVRAPTAGNGAAKTLDKPAANAEVPVRNKSPTISCIAVPERWDSIDFLPLYSQLLSRASSPLFRASAANSKANKSFVDCYDTENDRSNNNRSRGHRRASGRHSFSSRRMSREDSGKRGERRKSKDSSSSDVVIVKRIPSQFLSIAMQSTSVPQRDFPSDTVVAEVDASVGVRKEEAFGGSRYKSFSIRDHASSFLLAASLPGNARTTFAHGTSSLKLGQIGSVSLQEKRNFILEWINGVEKYRKMRGQKEE